MADNIAVTIGTGTTVPCATDDVAGVHYQLIKPAFGPLDTATLVTAAVGLPVSHVGALAVTGAFFQATQPVSGTVTVGNASIAVTGSFFQATQPVSIASMPSTPVTGTFFQATQPVSAASLPLPAGASTAAKQPALGTAGAASTDVITVQGIASGTPQPVSGTFFQATQPVSGTVTANAGTGTFAISAASLPLPTGAATETTLSALNTKVTAVNTGAVTISAALPTGANVIGALTANQSVNNAQIGGVAVAVGSGVTGTGVQRVVLATDVALPAGANSLGAVTVADVTATGTLTAAAQTVVLSMASGMSSASAQITGTWVGTITFEGTVDGTNWVAINGVFAGTSTPGSTITANGVVRLTPGGLTSIRLNMTAFTSGSAVITMRAGRGAGGTFLNQSLTAGTNIVGKFGIDQTTPGTTNLVSIGTNGTVAINAALPTGTNSIGTVQQATLTKGTQGATGVTTQDLKDAGRTLFSAATVIGGVTTVTAEAMLSLVVTRAGVAAAGATTLTVTSGKTLRITKITFSSRSTGATVLSARGALRMQPAAAATVSSPIIDIFSTTQQAAALAEAGDTLVVTYPDGLEFTGTQQIGISQVASAISGAVYVAMTGFEY